MAARRWFLARAEAAGLDTRVDTAANHSAVLQSRRAGSNRVLLLGSHLDSVPGGGRYDGALGVVAALHVLLAFKQAGTELPFALEAIDFTDEEGTLVGLLGSNALAGTLTREQLQSPRGGREALIAGLARAGLQEEQLFEARRDPSTLAGYLELHIEQGPRLEHDKVQIGVVTSIVGSRSFRIVLRGAAGHAGTTPMAGRRDAAVAAARIILAVREMIIQDFPGCVATVGDIRVEPGAFNVVPGLARLALEFRSTDASELDRIESALLARARAEAGRDQSYFNSNSGGLLGPPIHGNSGTTSQGPGKGQFVTRQTDGFFDILTLIVRSQITLIMPDEGLVRFVYRPRAKIAVVVPDCGSKFLCHWLTGRFEFGAIRVPSNHSIYTTGTTNSVSKVPKLMPPTITQPI